MYGLHIAGLDKAPDVHWVAESTVWLTTLLQITPPLRGSRREGGARSRAGGGQTPRPGSDYQRHGQPRVGSVGVASAH